MEFINPIQKRLEYKSEGLFEWDLGKATDVGGGGGENYRAKKGTPKMTI